MIVQERKVGLEVEVLELEEVKEGLMQEMEVDMHDWFYIQTVSVRPTTLQAEEGEMARVRLGLNPLLAELNTRKAELSQFEAAIAEKKSELGNTRSQIEEATAELR